MGVSRGAWGQDQPWPRDHTSPGRSAALGLGGEVGTWAPLDLPLQEVVWDGGPCQSRIPRPQPLCFWEFSFDHLIPLLLLENWDSEDVDEALGLYNCLCDSSCSVNSWVALTRWAAANPGAGAFRSLCWAWWGLHTWVSPAHPEKIHVVPRTHSDKQCFFVYKVSLTIDTWVSWRTNILTHGDIAS